MLKLCYDRYQKVYDNFKHQTGYGIAPHGRVGLLRRNERGGKTEWGAS